MISISPWTDLLKRPGPTDHIAQLYEDQEFLGRAVALFTGSGLKQGEGVIITATRAHWAALVPLLEAQGVDVAKAGNRGQLRVIDADETLPRLLVDGMPDADIFRDLVAGVVDRVRAASPTSRVRWWGEMVNLLWESGNVAGFIRLEEFLVEAARDHSVAIFCSFCMDPFEPSVYDSALPGAWRTHSHLIPVADFERFESAVNEAMDDVFGAAEAKGLRGLTSQALHPYAAAPVPQTTLFWLRRHLPREAVETLTRARRYYVESTSEME